MGEHKLDPSHAIMKSVHESLEEAAMHLESAIRKGTVVLDTTPLKHELAGLRFDCAELLLT
jgi:hypothetical protein